jgi:hypothetical protein
MVENVDRGFHPRKRKETKMGKELRQLAVSSS